MMIDDGRLWNYFIVESFYEKNFVKNCFLKFIDVLFLTLFLNQFFNQSNQDTS